VVEEEGEQETVREEGRERGGTERGRPLPSAAAPIDVLLALG